MKRPYVVTVQFEMAVVAENYEDARRLARRHAESAICGIDPDHLYTGLREVKFLNDVPRCLRSAIPWNADDETPMRDLVQP